MLMSLSCWREMMVTLRGTSMMLSSVPNTELKGRAVGRICCSGATPLTLNLSSWSTSSDAGLGSGVWADISPAALAAVSTASNMRSELGFIEYGVKVVAHATPTYKACHTPQPHA